MPNFIHHEVWARESMLPGVHDLRLEKLGIARSAGKFSYFYECAENVCLWHFIEKSDGMFVIDRVEHAAPAGNLVLIFPGQSATYHDNPAAPWHFTWGKLTGSAIMQALGEIKLTPANPAVQMQETDALITQLHDMFQRLKNAEPDPYAPYAASWELLQLLRRHLPWVPSVPAGVPLLERARALIEDPLHRLPNVQELADLLGIGRVTLFRLFRDQLDTTPTEYIDHVRYQRACAMLKESPLKIKEIGKLCGFATPQYFTNWFRGKSGQSPKIYRRGGLRVERTGASRHPRPGWPE